MRFKERVFIIAVSLGVASGAYGAQFCPDKTIDMGRGTAFISKDCEVSAPGKVLPDGSTRMFTFNAQGQFNVFISISSRNYASDTGSRTFYFFPLERKPSMNKNISGQLVVRTASRAAFVFDRHGKIKWISGATFTEYPNVSLFNKGGVEIKYERGILLDSGWSRGQPAIDKRWGISKFIDPSGKTCSVRNSEIFSYGGRAHLAFKSNWALSEFLHRRCSHLDLSSLNEPSTAGAGSSDRSRAGHPR